MLSIEDNELITRVGAGTPMGEVFRRYWIIAGISREIPEPDSPPVRTRLLGEDLVLFRDTDGQVGLLAEKCSHRRASLFYGRNEEGGLRCIYHGWKYDVAGNILETPAEPEASMIKHHLKHTAYPTYEKNGIIMTYMGPKAKQPLVPNYEWLTLPADHVDVEGKYWNEHNWLQGLEGDCDSSHLNYLHRNVNAQGNFDVAPGMATNIEFELDEGPWWIKGAAIRKLAPDQRYIRTNMFMMPCMGGPPQTAIDGVSDGFQCVNQVPADDTHTWRIDIWTKRSAPFNGPRFAGSAITWPGLPADAKPVDANWRKTANKENEYLIDREMQKTKVWAGIPFGAHTQDAVMTESMGAVADREHEHLGVGDTQIAAIRRMLLRIVKEVQAGQDPPGIAFKEEDNDFNLDCVHATLPLDADWRDIKVMQSKMLFSGAPPNNNRLI